MIEILKTPKAEANKFVIELLEELLKQAKAGDYHGIAVATAGTSASVWHAGGIGTELIGTAALLQRYLMTLYDGTPDEDA